MARKSQVILTNMCLIEDDQNRIVMQIRDPKMYSWSGAALPGGHIEEKESLHQAVVREIYEETGLTIHHPKLVGMKHWYSSEEGEVRWVAREELDTLELAYDLKNLLRIFDDKSLSELFYSERLENDFVREFW